MSVGDVLAGEAGQPDDLFQPEQARQFGLTFFRGDAGITIWVEDAALGDDGRPLTVDFDPAAFQHPSVWHNVISMMRKYALGGITGHTVMLLAENLFQQARLLAGELAQRWQAYQRLALEQQENVLQGFSFSMAPAMSIDEIGKAISEYFPSMGIHRWYVMFYSDVSSPQSISSPTPESYKLLFQYENEKFEIPPKQTFIGTGQLVPRGKTPIDHRYTAIIMPLTLAKKRFGFMWVEMGPADWEIYVRIRNLVSSALLRTSP